MRATWVFWLIAAVTVGLYCLMVFWSLPRIAAGAAGLVPFDMRPGGYDLQEVQQFLAVLTSDARSFYLSVQLRIDILYPAFLALTLGLALFRLAPRRFRSVAAALALPVAAFDWLENTAIAEMLQAGPEALTAEMVTRASLYTVIKSGATTAVFLLVLACLAGRGLKWLRRN